MGHTMNIVTLPLAYTAPMIANLLAGYGVRIADCGNAGYFFISPTLDACTLDNDFRIKIEREQSSITMLIIRYLQIVAEKS